MTRRRDPDLVGRVVEDEQPRAAVVGDPTHRLHTVQRRCQSCLGDERVGHALQPVGVEFGLSGAQLGLLAGLAYGAPFALAAIPFGILVDRFNRKALLTAALAGWSAATALCGATTGYASLLAGRAAVGVAEAGGSALDHLRVHGADQIRLR